MDRIAYRPRKPLEWIASTRKDILSIPEEMQRVFGLSLFEAQKGCDPLGARSFGEGLPHQVKKLADQCGGNAYRVAYTIFPAAVYVLDVFMKKSKTGIGTPLQIKRRIVHRHNEAVRHYELHYLLPKR